MPNSPGILIRKTPTPVLGALPLLALLAGCDGFGSRCTCDDELLMNVCVAGEYAGRASVTYVRETERVGIVDSIAADETGCFPERGGMQRILVLDGDTRVDSSAWFRQERADCCHYGEATVTF